MIKDDSIKILNLIKNNDGIEKNQLLNLDFEIQKIIDIILSECRCSITDKDGNYTRFGSSTDIHIIRILIQIFLSNMKEIPPEVVSMALTKEGIIGPFKKISFIKKYDKENNHYDIEMEDIFPNEFNFNIINDNLEIKKMFIKEIIKPYVKNIIFQSEDLMSKSPVGSYINKHIVRLLIPPKTNEQFVQRLISILKTGINSDENLIDNIANYIYINVMNNKFFKEELIDRTMNATKLQELGKVSISFRSLVENMSYETLQMIGLHKFPYGEIISVKNTFYTMISVLENLSKSFEGLNEEEILDHIEQINKNYTNKKEVLYRTEKVDSNKYGTSTVFVELQDIQDSIKNLCKMIKILLEKKDEIEISVYLKEVLRIHYRFIKIQPFEGANGRTIRAIVNILLLSKGMVGIFEKEKRKNYIEYINGINKLIKENEDKYIKGLFSGSGECLELENKFLDIKDIPFLLVKS